MDIRSRTAHTFRDTTAVPRTTPTTTTGQPQATQIHIQAQAVAALKTTHQAHITTEAVIQSTLDPVVGSIISIVTATKHTFQSVDNYIE